MIGLSSGWMCDVERGPDWLFVRPGAPADGSLGGGSLGGGSLGGGSLGDHFPADRPRAGGDGEASLLGESVWSVVEQHFVYRIVLECEQFGMLNSSLMAQLVGLQKRLRKRGGTLRLCGLSDENQQLLQSCRLDGLFPQFHSRSQAVLGHRPVHPR